MPINRVFCAHATLEAIKAAIPKLTLAERAETLPLLTSMGGG